MKRLLQKFGSQDSGSITIESLLWFPVYLIMAGLVIDSTSIALTQARMQAAVSDAARMVSLGHFTTLQAEDFIESKSLEGERFAADVAIDNGIVSASVQMPLADLIGLGLLSRSNNSFGSSAHFRNES